MDQNPYRAPQTTPVAEGWPVGLYLLLVFVVLPVVIAIGQVAYRIAVHGLFPAQH